MNLNPGKTEFTDAEHDQIRRDVSRARAEDNLTEAEVSRRAEVAAGTLNSYLKGRYTGNNDPVAVALHRWLQSRRVSEELRQRLPRAPSFQPLATSRMIHQRIHYARAMGRIVLIAGVPGVSKTASASQYRADTPRTWMATMEQASRGLPTMLLEILDAMGMTEERGTPQQLMRKIVAKGVEAEGVLLIDEAQHLSDQAIDQLRAINDKTRQLGRPLGIVMLGNEALYTKIGPTGSKAAFAQVSRRVAVRKYIIQPAREDVVALSHAWAAANQEVLTARDVEFLVEIAMKPGGLGNVEMTFEGALLAAFGTNEPLSLDHLQGAFSSIADHGRLAA